MSRLFLEKTLRSKLLVLLALLVTTAVSSTIIVVSVSRTHSTGSLVDWVQRDRATIQTIVQLLSASLAALQLYALSSFILFRTNLQLLSKPISLDSLKFCQAMSFRKFDSDLPLQFLVISLAYVAALQAPGAIWAGAITPVRITASVSALYSIPFYNNSLYEYWGQSCRPATGCSVLQNTTELGTFTNVPWKYLPGLLLNSVREASSRNSSTTQHKKLDNSGFSFQGRSYGVGSGVGLVGPAPAQRLQRVPEVKSYTFPENGYLSHVNCRYNKTSNLTFEELDLVQGGKMGSATFSGSVVVLQAVGSLPNGVWQGFTTMGIVDNGTAVALAAVADDTQYFYGFLGGTYYPHLNNIQCEATFSPTTFSVAVDVKAQNISVTPTSINVSNADIDLTGGLIVGEPVYAYISFFINLAILGLFLFESIWTRFWRNMPLFNCLDAKSAMLGAAASGRELSERVRNWEGDAADPQVGRLQVMLRTNKPVLEFLNSAGGESMPILDSSFEAVPLGDLHSHEDRHISQGDSTHVLHPGGSETTGFGWALR